MVLKKFPNCAVGTWEQSMEFFGPGFAPVESSGCKIGRIISRFYRKISASLKLSSCTGDGMNDAKLRRDSSLSTTFHFKSCLQSTVMTLLTCSTKAPGNSWRTYDKCMYVLLHLFCHLKLHSLPKSGESPESAFVSLRCYLVNQLQTIRRARLLAEGLQGQKWWFYFFFHGCFPNTHLLQNILLPKLSHFPFCLVFTTILFC